ncbi:MAG: L-lactate dehydrogenase complex protein LldG [Acidobacteriaceae bacterium]|nr:L-lactate dehydrogenase complex protein LldG [Acidobacteriaceae bacterium]
MSSRERVLERIQKANAKAASSSQLIPRDYDRSNRQSASETLALFEERLRDYDARVFPVRREEVAARAAEILREGNRQRIVVPPELLDTWRADGPEWIPDHELSVDALNAVDGVMTAATVGVAASGSIALQHGPAEGRRILTLLPDYHLCVIGAAQVVETLPEAFARLDPTRPVTFFSGPSATADIEMTRIKGVHGPRFLDVLLVED